MGGYRTIWHTLDMEGIKVPRIVVQEIVKELGGCPVEVVTDLGTENSLLASIQSYFRENPDAHRYVPSPRNQCIEGWWSFFSKNRSAWWRNLFQDLEAQHKIDMSSDMCKECLWYCFSKLLQEECNTVREHWNTHYIRFSRHNTVKGRPDSLYFLPEYHGATSNLLASVATNEIVCVTQEITLQEHDNEHQEYFEYVRQGLGLALPTTWKEALQCYERLIDIAENGYST